MVSRFLMGFMFVGLLALGAPRLANAQFAVIDVASLTQLIQEYETLQQELTTAQNQLSQARSEYAAMTGSRGMERLLGGTVRNYLPGSWTQLSQVMSGSSSGYGGLAGQVQSLIQANAILSATQVSRLSPAQQAQLTFARRSSALAQVSARTALANSSERFSALQQLISAIGSATDQKGALDLSARIAAEVGMLQNEHTKIAVLSEVQRAEERAHAQQLREQAIADQGSLRRLPPMGL
jgi:type IV secretion system protein VirB5